MDKPLGYDLYCGAGGCSYGYMQAGFEMVGIDINRQPRYIGSRFIQMDALEFVERYLNGEYPEAAFFHASPPCQFGSEQTPIQHRGNHPNLIPQTRELLRATGKPYVIENVENTRHHLINPIKLCGSMFGINLWRHRYFEIWPEQLWLTPSCNHSQLPVLITGTTRRSAEKGGRFEFSAQECREASGLYWMTRTEMDQAIPPVFTKWIGERLMESLGSDDKQISQGDFHILGVEEVHEPSSNVEVNATGCILGELNQSVAVNAG